MTLGWPKKKTLHSPMKKIDIGDSNSNPNTNPRKSTQPLITGGGRIQPGVQRIPGGNSWQVRAASPSPRLRSAAVSPAGVAAFGWTWASSERTFLQVSAGATPAGWATGGGGGDCLDGGGIVWVRAAPASRHVVDTVQNDWDMR